MADLKAICPVCENEISFTDQAVKLAVMFRNKTNDKTLVSCPQCCHVLELPDVPTDGKLLDEYLSGYDQKEQDDWLACLPLLDSMDAKMPNGFVSHLGVKYWTPGDETQPLSARQYMMAYGVNPVCAWAKMKQQPPK